MLKIRHDNNAPRNNRGATADLAWLIGTILLVLVAFSSAVRGGTIEDTLEARAVAFQKNTYGKATTGELEALARVAKLQAETRALNAQTSLLLEQVQLVRTQNNLHGEIIRVLVNVRHIAPDLIREFIKEDPQFSDGDKRVLPLFIDVLEAVFSPALTPEQVRVKVSEASGKLFTFIREERR
jgi:hypothetical protein